MNELSLISRQEPGFVAIDNFEQLKAALSAQLDVYRSIVYTVDGVKAAKADKKTLTDLKKDLNEKRKEIKAYYMAPYEAASAQIDELIALIDEPLALIKEFIDSEAELAKAAKRAEVTAYYEANVTRLGDFKEAVFNSPAFYDKKWDNASTSVKTYRDAIKAKTDAAAEAINTILATGGKHTTALLNRYFETLSMEGIAEYKASLEASEQVASGEQPLEVDDDDKVTGYKVLRITGTRRQMLQVMEQLKLLGMEVDELEDGMPQDMPELTAPDFDSFVAFDIETTGTFGAASGDAAPQITEIGAVKVVNGEIVDRFDMLANPGRKITPRIARLTGITDDMVANQPPIAEVMAQFKTFVGDSVLVGHNIKSCDIPYITKAARQAGIAFENPYFDTYRFAKTMKDAHGWENVKLEYLSQQFGISQPDAHRAWCDAEANVGVYFKLKELSK